MEFYRFSRLFVWVHPVSGSPENAVRPDFTYEGTIRVQLSGDLAVMYNTWLWIPVARDGQYSGVFADWLEENPHTLPEGLAGVLAGWMRARFENPNNNAGC